LNKLARAEGRARANCKPADAQESVIVNTRGSPIATIPPSDLKIELKYQSTSNTTHAALHPAGRRPPKYISRRHQDMTSAKTTGLHKLTIGTIVKVRRHHLRGSKSNQVGARAQRRSRAGSPAYLMGEHSKVVRHIGRVTVWKIVTRVFSRLSTPFGSSDSRIIQTGHLQAGASRRSRRRPGEDLTCNTQDLAECYLRVVIISSPRLQAGAAVPAGRLFSAISGRYR
jgi:hypothetical protein